MVSRTAVPFILLLGFCGGLIFAQTNAGIAGAGYNGLAPLRVAPGQVITVFVSGVGSKVTQRVSAAGVPWPTSLQGISAAVVENESMAAPIATVYPFNTCVLNPEPPPCQTEIGVTLQVPFELFPNNPNSEAPPSYAELIVSDDAGHSAALLLDPEIDAIHVLRAGDTIFAANLASPRPSDGIVTHANGDAVSAENPAKAGEQLVMYAVGLGATTPGVQTGKGSPSPAASAGGFVLNFDYRVNARPSPGSALLQPMPAKPVFVGLTPGFVGLYQINFVVPPAPAGLPACVDPRTVGPGLSAFRFPFSNLTVTLVGFWSFDGVALCVATPQ
ncbi:MAG TPA: hypothetical protein VJN43_14865 [Bryobacteraceae bacterium]|nr:hypothetical protein [Bryobacteraceae bacterium]